VVDTCLGMLVVAVDTYLNTAAAELMEVAGTDLVGRLDEDFGIGLIVARIDTRVVYDAPLGNTCWILYDLGVQNM